MIDRELMQQALDALEWCYDVTEWPANGKSAQDKAIEALRARLAQPEPEPVAWMYEYGTDHGDAVNQIFWHKNLRLEKPTGLVRNVVPLYTVPPQRKPLTLWTEAQHERAYRNSPELHKDVKSLAAFKRVAKEIAAMYGIKGADEEIDELAEANLDFNWKDGVEDFARAIEAKLKAKNG